MSLHGQSNNPWRDMGGSLGDLNSANRYVNVDDDPVNVVDPSGKDCVADFFFIIAGLASAAWSTFQLLGGIGAILASSPVGLAGMAAEVTFTGVPIAEILTVLFIVIGVAAAAYAFVVALNQCLGLNVVAPL